MKKSYEINPKNLNFFGFFLYNYKEPLRNIKNKHNINEDYYH